MTIPDSVRELAAAVRLVVFDFDGVFTDNTVYVSEDGREMVRCWRSDGLGVQALAAAGIPAIILSTETNPVVAARAAKLKMRCIHGLADKSEELTRVAAVAGVELSAVAYVGNDVNDIACLRSVGLPIAVADAHQDIAEAVRFVTRHEGGRGAVREVCDLLLAARGASTPRPQG